MKTEPIAIKGTSNTPAVSYSTQDHGFSIIGNSIPENAGEFYAPIIERVRGNIPAMADGSTFTFCLPYFNSSSLKAIYMLLSTIKEGMDQGKRFDVIWHIEEGDDFMSDAAETLSEMVGIEMTLKEGLLVA